MKKIRAKDITVPFAAFDCCKASSSVLLVWLVLSLAQLQANNWAPVISEDIRCWSEMAAVETEIDPAEYPDLAFQFSQPAAGVFLCAVEAIAADPPLLYSQSSPNLPSTRSPPEFVLFHH
ncbi:MAG: hypothetical protein LJE65_12355 [Desulfobacteraceae bacterium]|nr:hypothetical protein [Desulfobacteraceae bacterium]